MKILAASDIHCNKKHCGALVKSAPESDVVIIAGDLASVRRGLQKTVDWLRPIEKPVILVPGNNETLSELRDACAQWNNAFVLHGTSIIIDNLEFFGIGGGIPVTPFGSWSYDFTEDQGRELLTHCPDNAVLISHSPPKGTLDKSSFGRSLGSKAVHEAILEKKPKLVICGHIHESSGKQAKLEQTIIINAGPRGMFIEV